jgi:hypothetical protein
LLREWNNNNNHHNHHNTHAQYYLTNHYHPANNYLLFRFYLGLLDSHEENTMLMQCIIEKQLLIKFPQLLLQSLSEMFIIFNKCIEHPWYNPQIIQYLHHLTQNLGTLGNLGNQDTTVLLMEETTRMYHDYTPDLTRDERFQIYNYVLSFYQQNDEIKLQIVAKLVQDLLAFAVDHSNEIFPDRTRPHHHPLSSLLLLSSSTGKLSAFETAIEDVLLLLRSPLLKVTIIIVIIIIIIYILFF